MKKHFLIFGAGLLLLSACNSVKAPEASQAGRMAKNGNVRFRTLRT